MFVKSIVVWLDEPKVNKAYVYGSNDELYQISRKDTSNLWQEKSFLRIPYSEYPLSSQAIKYYAM